MKKRLALNFTIGIVVILIGSLVYAADRRKQAKLLEPATDTVSEEQALKAELLDALKDNEKKLPDTAAPVKVVSNKSHNKKGQVTSGK